MFKKRQDVIVFTVREHKSSFYVITVTQNETYQ
jgi:hypothetical protein